MLASKTARLVSAGHPAPALRLLCFPYAGAGASVYADWRLPEQLNAEVWAIQPPGRENRRNEPMPANLDELIEAYATQLAPLLDRPFAFFGHSFGALAAFELTRLLRHRGGPQPVRLFLSGCAAPHRPSRRDPISTLPDDRFVPRMREIAGASPSAIRDPELLLFYAPLTRGDCRLLEQHRYSPQAPLEIPLTCFTAVDDSELEVADVAWDRYTSRGCRLRRFQGGHLFLRDHQDQLLAEIAADLPSPAGDSGGTHPYQPPGLGGTAASYGSATMPRMAPDSAAWNDALAVHVIGGRLSAATLAAALNQVVSRYPALRTRFPVAQGAVTAVVEPPDRVAVEVPVRRPGHALWADDLRAIAGQRFDLAHDLPVRASLLRHWHNETVVLVLHRLAGPQWSVSRLYRELAERYSALAAGEVPTGRPAADAPEPRPDPISCRDLLARAVPTGAPLAIGRADPPAPSSAAAVWTQSLAPTAHAAVGRMAGQLGIDEATVLLAGFLALLACHGGGPDLTVGLPVAECPHSPGGVTGVRPWRVRVDVKESFARLATGLRDSHPEPPGTCEFCSDVESSDMELMDAQPSVPRYAFRHRPVTAAGYTTLGGLRVKTTPVDTGHSRHDLECLVDLEPGRITVRAVYRTDVVTPADARALVQRYDALLCRAGARPDRPLAELDWWSSADRAFLAGARRVEPGATIHDQYGRLLPPGVRGELHRDGTATGEEAQWTHNGRLARTGSMSDDGAVGQPAPARSGGNGRGGA